MKLLLLLLLFQQPEKVEPKPFDQKCEGAANIAPSDIFTEIKRLNQKGYRVNLKRSLFLIEGKFTIIVCGDDLAGSDDEGETDDDYD